MRGLAPPLTEHRLHFVHQAFDILDKTGDGVVTIEDLQGTYDPSWHPDVKEGTADPEKVLRKLLDQFDTGDVKDGIVTIEEFEEYYQNLSASIDDDVYFELMMRNAWHIEGGEGAAANTTNKRVLVTGRDGKQRVGKYSKRRRASIAYMESTVVTVVDISMTPPCVKPVSVS